MLLANRCIGSISRMGGCPAILAEFVDSFVDMCVWNSAYLCAAGEYVHYPRPPRCSIHDVARNMIAEGMRGDFVLYIDSDHAWEPDLAYRLINLADTTGADVVTGMYQYRQPPHSPVLFAEREGGPWPLGDWDRKATALEVFSAGAGCLFVRRKVFDRIERELKEKPFNRYGGMGEDHSFFQRLHKLGIKVVCNPQIECHHLQVRPLRIEDYDPESVELNKPEPVKGYA